MATTAPWSEFVSILRECVAEEYPCADLADEDAIDAAKCSMRAIVPARFDTGARRSKQNVRGTSVIGCDIDKAPPELVAAAIAKCSGASIVVHSSPTDGLDPTVRKIRIYALTDRELTPDEIWPVVCAFAAHIGLRPWLDENTKDGGARIYFAGRIAGTPAREVHEFTGPPIPVDRLLARYPEPPTTPAPSEHDEAPGVHEVIAPAAGDELARVARHVVEIVAPHVAQRGHRHEIARGLGGVFARSGWNDEQISALGERVFAKANEPAGRVGDMLEGAGKVRSNATEAPGMPTLKRAGLNDYECADLRHFARREFADMAERLEQKAETESAPEPSAWIEMSVTDICAPLGPVNYIVRDLDMATDGAPTIFGGYGFSGKTMAAQSAALSIVSGRDVWGRYRVTPKSGGWHALHVDFEQGRRLTADRYQRLMRGMGVTREEVEGRLVLVPMPRFYLNPANIEATEEFLRRKMEGFDICLIDSFLASAPGLEENDSRARHLLDMFTRIAERIGCLANVIAHARKTANGQGDPRQALRGTSAIFDACGSVLLFEGAEPKAPKQVTHTKARISGQPLDPFALTFTDGFAGDERSVVVTASGAQEVKQAAGAARLEADCLALLGFVASQPGRQFAGGVRVLAAKTGLPLVRVRTALDTVESDGRLARDPNATTQNPLRFIPGAG